MRLKDDPTWCSIGREKLKEDRDQGLECRVAEILENIAEEGVKAWARCQWSRNSGRARAWWLSTRRMEWGGKGKDLCLNVRGGAGVVTRKGHPSSEKGEGFKPRATLCTLVECRDVSGWQSRMQRPRKPCITRGCNSITVPSSGLSGFPLTSVKRYGLCLFTFTSEMLTRKAGCESETHLPLIRYPLGKSEFREI